MPRRRPPGAGPALTTLFAILLTIPWVPNTAAQQQQPLDNSHGSSLRGTNRLHTIARPEFAQLGRKPAAHSKKQEPITPVIAHNARAVATASSAPAISAVRANPAQNAASDGLMRPSARSIQDLEVEDFVLLATVDGHIHARDRYNGDEIWELDVHRPMLETIYNTKNDSDRLTGSSEQAFIWIVEPKEDGALYILSPGPYPILQNLGMTVKQLANELSPYLSDDPPVVYTAQKKNIMYVVDARTGTVNKMFSPSGSTSVDTLDRCDTQSPDYFGSRTCESKGIFNLGQTEYTISIHNQKTDELICSIKYAEWTPNQHDNDLHSQYAEPKDAQYIYTRYDGHAIAYDHKRSRWYQRPVYERKMPSPVARVFDVVRRRDDDSAQPALILLAQPPGPAFLEDKAKNVWLNTTEAGSWYALSEINYPAVTDSAPAAPCYTRGELLAWDGPHVLPSRQGLVGVHQLDYRVEPPPTYPAIAAPTHINTMDSNVVIPRGPNKQLPMIDPPPKIIIESHSYYPWVVAFITLCALSTVGVFQFSNISSTELIRKILTKYVQLQPKHRTVAQPNLVPVEVESLIAPEAAPSVDPAPLVEVVEEQTKIKSAPSEDLTEAVVDPRELEISTESPAVHESKEKKVTFDVPDDDEDEDELAQSRATISETPSPSEEEVIDGAKVADDVTAVPTNLPTSMNGAIEAASQDSNTSPPTPVKKKKTHRGKRGGQKGKNKKFKEGDEVDQIIDTAKQLIQTPTLQPDEMTNSGEDMQDVSNTKRIGKLTIDFDRVLGNGSGGTFVFEGKWNDRDVAVKRMLPQYFGLAEQEVKLLQESDHHPNVIRYYDDERDENFLYIAVELCQASLFDLYRDGRPCDDVTDPQRRLVNEINIDVPQALHQLAKGVNHLHSLRIIHRDIKPQNILITYPKKNQASGPRLVISDFGLCKTLPDNMSTLIGTTGNAGTVGWKAPELILQPKDIGLGSSTGHSRESSTSTDAVMQGVKRAVDIFSLGCVFYYVLTNGSHPFDDDEGWAQMREYNIKKNKVSFTQLSLGDDSEEPIHLISWMLENRPEDRPTAADVMNHPFFWNAEKRLSFLCDCSDHWEREPREPPSEHLAILEDFSYEVLDKKRNFMAKLDHGFIASLGKQRKYTGDRLLDLLRALRNKKNHYEDMEDSVKLRVGSLPDGYLRYWTVKFPKLLISCYDCVVQCGLQNEPRFKMYFEATRN